MEKQARNIRQNLVSDLHFILVSIPKYSQWIQDMIF